MRFLLTSGALSRTTFVRSTPALIRAFFAAFASSSEPPVLSPGLSGLDGCSGSGVGVGSSFLSSTTVSAIVFVAVPYSEVAAALIVSVVVPAAFGVTVPLDETDATDGLPEE